MGICLYHEFIKATTQTTKISTLRIKELSQYKKDDSSKIIAIYVDNKTSVDFGNKYFAMFFAVIFLILSLNILLLSKIVLSL